ncbi:carboxy-S-adenosyl-L-methionine synthase CmoA [Nocardiopsis sp. ATB16-24]|uniref:carboxy-S-adenosyl-L-methionine synthase CmoA n=1 Tax=Nocardiopsis sp. ATB16-24 TaxID=3019555 RepID=UPI0025529656|nr:carboxy-S-adenosyl-L-methionine synthase CmoA [Nocardiopsis sp. ATB16-24]
MRDEVFATDAPMGDFVFDENVAHVFDDMLDRSVPFYGEIQRMSVELGKRFLGEGGAVYDIGCSTGNTLVKLMGEVDPGAGVRFVGVEPSAAMRDRCRDKIRASGLDHQVDILEDPIELLPGLPGARVVIMLFTLQFVRPPQRDAVLAKICDALEPGGALLLGEKVLADDPEFTRTYIDLYHAHKERSGYSRTEIARKRESLENVLVPYRVSENREALVKAGFSRVDEVFRWYNFAVYLAVR